MFLPNLIQLHIFNKFGEEVSVLWMDDCLSYVIADVIGLTTKARGRAIIFALHTTKSY
jgi:hypothetical protein